MAIVMTSHNNLGGCIRRNEFEANFDDIARPCLTAKNKTKMELGYIDGGSRVSREATVWVLWQSTSVNSGTPTKELLDATQPL